MIKIASVFFILIFFITYLTSFFIKEYSQAKNTINTNFYEQIINDISDNKSNTNIFNQSWQEYINITTNVFFDKNKNNNINLYMPIIEVDNTLSINDKKTQWDSIFDTISYTNNYFNINNWFARINIWKEYEDGIEKEIYFYLWKLYFMCDDNTDCWDVNNLTLR